MNEESYLWIVAKVGKRHIKTRVSRLRSSIWKLNSGSVLEIQFRMDTPPNSYLVARVMEKKVYNDWRRLNFAQINFIGRFRVHVYREEPTSDRWERDFAHQIRPSTEL